MGGNALNVYDSVCALYLNINLVFYMSVDDNVVTKNPNKLYPFFNACSFVPARVLSSFPW